MFLALLEAVEMAPEPHLVMVLLVEPTVAEVGVEAKDQWGSPMDKVG